MYEQKRNRLARILQYAGWSICIPQGGIFILARLPPHAILPLEVKQEAKESDKCIDWIYCPWLSKVRKVTAITCSAFYCKENQHLGAEWIRFAF